MKLNLNFKLNSPEERVDYTKSYLDDIDTSSLNEANLETMADYILYSDIYNRGAKEVGIELQSKDSPWKGEVPLSLEDLQQQTDEDGKIKTPRFYSLGSIAPSKAVHRKINRAEVVARIGDDAATLSIWKALWRRIDELDYGIEQYEFLSGKRRPDLPIRSELIQRLDQVAAENSLGDPKAYRLSLKVAAQQWEPLVYTRNKRQLVQLYSQQYSLLDNLGERSPILHHPNSADYWDEADSRLDGFFPFMDKRFAISAATHTNFERAYQEDAVRALRQIDEGRMNYVDLRNPETIRTLLNNYEDVLHCADTLPLKEREIYANLLYFLYFYIEECHFDDVLQHILTAKMHRVSNKKICEEVEQNFGHAYKENYISTIYTNQIVNRIAEKASDNYRFIEYVLMGENVFKRCSKCGRLLPRNSDYFNKRSAPNSDGFTVYCKDCRPKGGKK